jgi:hypothetical protein
MNEPQFSGETNAEAAAQVDNVQSEQYTSVEQQGGQVPLEALQAERAQRQGLQDELRVIKDHLALMQAQQSQNSQQAAKDPMDSMSDDDVLTVGEAKRYLSKMTQQTQTSIQELKMTQQNPDYNDVVTKYLPEVLKNNPKLRKILMDTQDYELAYYLAKNSDEYKSSNKKEKKNADAERIVQNSQNVGSLSSVGSSSTMNTARRYKEMSDADFQKIANRNLGAF